jgi:hypothetical protein
MITRRPHFLVINRFDDECGGYQRFAQGINCRLAFITLPAGACVIDQRAALETVVVPDLDLGTIRAQARGLIERHGPFDGVVGISEHDVLATAQLRAELGLPGWATELVRSFRDKPLMKAAVARAGLRVPRYIELHDGVDTDAIIGRTGLPLVLKPRSEGASRGVAVIGSVTELRSALAGVELGSYECEEYVGGTVMHVDGSRRGAEFAFVSASAYINTCLDFAHGIPLGSALLDPGPERQSAIEFAGRCLDALELRDGPFHLELIAPPAGGLVFLEVGIRPGGSEIAGLHKDLFGVDLFGDAFRVTLGLPPMTSPDLIRSPRGGGWVAVPEPRPLPCRVLARTSLAGKIPELYAEMIPPVGTIFRGDGGYDHIGGRFRLRGRDRASVTRAAREIMRRYRIVAEPLTAATLDPAPAGARE